MGCSVIAVERSPVLGALVHDGLARARAEGPPAVRTIVERIKLVVADARQVLAGLRGTSAPEVVYLDPMYPPRKKAALPKKEMRICRRLVGDDTDVGELLAVARGVTQRRVVVKRPRHAPPLAPSPAMTFAGKQVRYDVYHPLE
jgi:16S rRNA (guanine1516-N2)-methyltransferase